MISFFITSLAVYRITVFVVREHGPWHMMRRAREVASLVTELVECFNCTSFWIGWIAAAAHFDGARAIGVGLAHSGIAIFLDAIIEYCRVHTSLMGGCNAEEQKV